MWWVVGILGFLIGGYIFIIVIAIVETHISSNKILKNMDKLGEKLKQLKK